MPPLPTIHSERHYVLWSSGHQFIVASLTPIMHDAISLYLVEGFQWNLLQVFIVWRGIAKKVFIVTGQRSRS